MVIYAHFRLNEYVVVLTASDVLTWNTRTDELTYSLKKLKAEYFEEGELPLIGTARDCGMVNEEVFFLSKDSKIVKIWFHREEHRESVVFSGAKAFAVEEKLGILAVLTDIDEIYIMRASDSQIMRKETLPLLNSSKYTTIAFVDGGSVILSSVEMLKHYKALTENVLHLYDHNLVPTGNIQIKLASPLSKKE